LWMDRGLYRFPKGLAKTFRRLDCNRVPIASAKQDPIVRIRSEMPILWDDDPGLTTVRKWLIKIMFPQTLENLALFKIL
jgi:hypothetical protein